MSIGRVISWGQWWLVIGIITLLCDAVTEEHSTSASADLTQDQIGGAQIPQCL